MGTDPWQLWRDLAMQASPVWARGAATSAAAATGASPASVFERFAEAARSYFAQRAAATASGTVGGTADAAAADAARRFGDRLRETLEQAWPLLQAFFFVAPGASIPTSTAGAPALGPLREHQQRAERGMRALARAEEAQQRLQMLWSDVLREAALAFAAKIGHGPADASAESMRALYDAWIDCAEEAYARSARSPEFAQALADLVNASSAWRAEWQAGYECWARSLDLPTRSEVNSLNARIAALESTLRENARPVDATSAPGISAAARPAKRPSTGKRRRPR